MLDLSKCSLSGKFCLVTKFKKERNSMNREAHSSLGAPVHLWGDRGDCSLAGAPQSL